MKIKIQFNSSHLRHGKIRKTGTSLCIISGKTVSITKVYLLLLHKQAKKPHIIEFIVKERAFSVRVKQISVRI
jgi:hypothetical protein